MNLLVTITPRGTRYYRDGRRVTQAAYYEIAHRKTLECFQTTIEGDTTRHFVCARTA